MSFQIDTFRFLVLIWQNLFQFPSRNEWISEIRPYTIPPANWPVNKFECHTRDDPANFRDSTQLWPGAPAKWNFRVPPVRVKTQNHNRRYLQLPTFPRDLPESCPGGRSGERSITLTLHLFTYFSSAPSSTRLSTKCLMKWAWWWVERRLWCRQPIKNLFRTLHSSCFMREDNSSNNSDKALRITKNLFWSIPISIYFTVYIFFFVFHSPFLSNKSFNTLNSLIVRVCWGAAVVYQCWHIIMSWELPFGRVPNFYDFRRFYSRLALIRRSNCELVWVGVPGSVRRGIGILGDGSRLYC